jgi:hypothetical protein
MRYAKWAAIVAVVAYVAAHAVADGWHPHWTPATIGALATLVLFVIGTRVTGIVAYRHAMRAGERVRRFYRGE